MMLADLLAELGVPGVTLRLASLGSLDARRGYMEELKAHLRAHEGELAEDVRERIDLNPLRAFDSDDEGTQEVMASAPKILEGLQGADAEHFAEVRALLDAAGIDYTIDSTLVRGLDYYTRTIFSFVCEGLGCQVGDRRRWSLRRTDRAARRSRRLRRSAGRQGSSASCWRWTSRRRSTRAGRLHRGRRWMQTGGGRWRLASELRHAGSLGRAGPRRALPQGPAQTRRSDRRRAPDHPRGRRWLQLRDMQSGEQHPTDSAKLIDEIAGGRR